MQSSWRRLPACFVVIFLLVPALARGETAVQAWVQRYDGPGSSYSHADGAAAVAVDGSNNVIVTGSSVGSGTGDDFATVKYSSAGVPLWTNRYDGPVNGSDVATALVVDTLNNVIVTGTSDAGGESGPDYLTIKYSSDGLPLWSNRYSGPIRGGDRPYGVAVDGSNNVIVTGYSSGGIETGSDYATIKYSSAGESLWTNRYTRVGNYGDNAIALAVDRNNDVIVTGSSFSTLSMLSADYATIKYSSDGLPLWTNLYNGPAVSVDMPSAVAVDGHNDVLVTGTTAGMGFNAYLIIKYSSDGVPLWTNLYTGAQSGLGDAPAVAVDDANNVIVAGSSGSGYVTVKFSSAGDSLWTNFYSGPQGGYGKALAVAVDPEDNVIVTGYSASTNGYPYNYDYATIKYSSAGVALWTNRYNGPGNADDEAVDLVVDHSGNVIVTGYSTGNGGNVDYATMKYICVPEPMVNGLPQPNGGFQLRVDKVLQPGTLVIEASTNLAGWNAIFTNTAPTNAVFYTDPDASKSLLHFYRAYQFP